MQRKIILLMMVFMLFINASFGISIGNFKSTNNDADMPTWIIGDSWTYYISISGESESNIIELIFQDITFTVEEVQSEFYKMNIYGTFTGYASLKLPFLPFQVTGSINNGQITAKSYVSKNNLLLSEINDVELFGTIGRYDFDADGEILIKYGTPGALQFPLNVSDIWTTEKILIYPNLNINILGLNFNIPDILMSTYGAQNMSIFSHNVEVDSWDLIEIDTFDYDALRIVSPNLAEGKHEYWYAPSVGNIIIVQSWGIFLFGEPGGYFGQYDVDIELKRTTYDIKTNPPTKPTDFTGDSLILVGIKAFYTATSTDPDGDMIRYICDWDDGTKSASEIFYDSGLTGEITHIWTEKGEYNLKVKARDKSGAESSWSEPITITVFNNEPEKPDTPYGPTEGKIRTESYTYNTSTIEVDGHNLFYLFDWDDGTTSGWIGPYASGETATASHIWNRKGSYNIMVKAKDEYGEESIWSDPLSVTMPKSKFKIFEINLPRLSFLQRILYILLK